MTGDHPDVLDMKSGFVLIPIGVFSPSEYKLLGQDTREVDIHKQWCQIRRTPQKACMAGYSFQILHDRVVHRKEMLQ